MKKYKVQVPFKARSFAVILILFVIPGNYVLKDLLNSISIPIITLIQSTRSPHLDQFFRITLYIGNNLTLVLVPPIIYNLYDVRRAVKQTFINCFGMYVYSIIALITKEPRPFWSDSSIKGILCEGGYASPFLELFTASVLYGSYSIELFSHISPLIKKISYLVTASIVIILAFGGIYLGSNFPQQIFVTYCYSYVYLTFVFTFDNAIMDLTMKTCFDYRKNKKNSIFFIVFTLFLLIGVVAVYGVITLAKEVDIKWIKNSHEDCGNLASVGGTANLNKAAWIFYNLGVVFGCMFCSRNMSMFWWSTCWWKRVIRCFGSAGVSIAIFYVFRI